MESAIHKNEKGRASKTFVLSKIGALQRASFLGVPISLFTVRRSLTLNVGEFSLAHSRFFPARDVNLSGPKGLFH